MVSGQVEQLVESVGEGMLSVFLAFKELAFEFGAQALTTMLGKFGANDAAGNLGKGDCKIDICVITLLQFAVI